MASSSVGGERSAVSSARRRVWIVAGLVMVALGLAALVSQLGAGGGGAPLNAVAVAAVKTREEQGGRAVMRVVGTLSSGKSFTATGRTVFNAEGRTRAVMKVTPAGSAAPVRIEGISDGAVVYMRSPKLPIPEGAEWMKIDFEAAVGLKLPVPNGNDPREELSFLRFAGDVRKLGEEDVRGVPTTRYRAAAGVPETVKRLREEGEEELAEQVEKTGSPMRFEVWIDSSGLVRRLQIFNLHTRGEGDEQSTQMTAEFFDLGLEPQIEVPDPSKVYDATSLAESP